ncbi:hypothetical protein [Olegusella massiliensis]|uniref:hypothetical protein n=1 Tax=Olegusella massiliensis TaxID=1776381 RepID=UPI0008398B11|nr:hypothetical protein [Olegusella massiliensis]
METISDILDKYRIPGRLDYDSVKMRFVRLYASAASGRKPVEDIKLMIGKAPMDKYLLPEDYENWKRLTA